MKRQILHSVFVSLAILVYFVCLSLFVAGLFLRIDSYSLKSPFFIRIIQMMRAAQRAIAVIWLGMSLKLSRLAARYIHIWTLRVRFLVPLNSFYGLSLGGQSPPQLQS